MAPDVTAAFRGITTPLSELTQELERRGWEAQVDFKNGVYLCKARSTHGEIVERTGTSPQTAVGNALEHVVRKEHIRTPAQQKVGMWQTTFNSQLEQIAKAYSQAPVYDPKAAPAWRELAEDSLHRYQVLAQHLQIEVVDDPEPYENAQQMCQDVHQKQHFYVSRANSEHPIWSVEQNVAFRTVHDVLGHCVSGGDFGWEGENLACAAHFPLLSPNAQRALFTECIAQTAYAAFYRSFGPQKVAFLDEFLEDAQGSENNPAHTGIHPSQSVPPVAMPEVPTSAPAPTPFQPGDIAPHQEAPGLTPVFTSEQPAVDPNHGWSSNVEPLPNNAYLTQRDPLTGLDPLDAKGVIDNAHLIDTQWYNMDPALQKQAVVNAFRVVLLSPRKDLRWNAVHYQDISHIPADVADPKVYWDALEARRRAHNESRGRHPEAHMIYYKPLQRYYRMVNQLYPQLSFEQARAKADGEVFHRRIDIEHQITHEEQNKPEGKRKNADEVEREVNKRIADWLNKLLKANYNPETDHSIDEDQLSLVAAQQDLFTGENAQLYGSWMGAHLKAIGKISQYADDLVNAALQDIYEHDGTGHHFRAKVLSLDIPGVGPKVASFAWLLLAPKTSQLATIDTHMLDVLGYTEKDMNSRDYFRFERELAAGRDAAGYNHVPLGSFQWGMWDLKRTGPGTHQDHSAMKVLDPVPHHQIDWASKTPNIKGESWNQLAPPWWQDTQPIRQQVAEDWRQNEAAQVGANSIPFKTATKPFSYWWDKFKPYKKTEAVKVAEYAAGKHLSESELRDWLDSHRSDVDTDFEEFKKAVLKKFDRVKTYHSKTAASKRRPWYTDEGGAKMVGPPGHTIMRHLREQHGLPTAELWKQYGDDRVGKDEDHDGIPDAQEGLVAGPSAP